MSMLKTIAFAIFCFIAVVSNAATMTVAPLPASELQWGATPPRMN